MTTEEHAKSIGRQMNAIYDDWRRIFPGRLMGIKTSAASRLAWAACGEDILYTEVTEADAERHLLTVVAFTATVVIRLELSFDSESHEQVTARVWKRSGLKSLVINKAPTLLYFPGDPLVDYDDDPRMELTLWYEGEAPALVLGCGASWNHQAAVRDFYPQLRADLS